MPAPSRPPSQAPEGPMDIDSHPTVTTTRSSSPLPSATIPPPGPLSADHIQWIMASIARLEGKIDNLKDEVKRQVGKITAQQCLQLPMPMLPNFPQQLTQLPPPPAFSQPQQSDLPFSAQDIVDWGNSMYPQQPLLPHMDYRMDDWNIQNLLSWLGDGSGGQASGGQASGSHLH